MKKLIVTVVALTAIPFIGGAAAGGKPSTGSCTVSGTTVTASGLPTNQDIWLRYVEDTGTVTQKPLGKTSDGTLVTTVPDPDFPTSAAITDIKFTSKPRGGYGDDYNKTYAEC